MNFGFKRRTGALRLKSSANKATVIGLQSNSGSYDLDVDQFGFGEDVLPYAFFRYRGDKGPKVWRVQLPRMSGDLFEDLQVYDYEHGTALYGRLTLDDLIAITDDPDLIQADAVFNVYQPYFHDEED